MNTGYKLKQLQKIKSFKSDINTKLYCKLTSIR